MTALFAQWHFACPVQFDLTGFFAWSRILCTMRPRRGAVWFLQVLGHGLDGQSVFRMLRMAAGKENGQAIQ
ncbi:MAG: hypothetical protein DMG70_32950, partial [Acidobacteria bacterium]